MKNIEMTVTPVPCSVRPILYDETQCIGCNRCAKVCQVDILIPNPEKGKPPIVAYPGECYSLWSLCHGMSKTGRRRY